MPDPDPFDATHEPNRRRCFRVRAPLSGPGPLDRGAREWLQPLEVDLRVGRTDLRARLVDLSLGGMSVLVRGAPCPGPGEPLWVRFRTPSAADPIELGAVVRYRLALGGGFKLGLELRLPGGAAGLIVEEALQRFVVERQRIELRYRTG